MGTMKKNTTKKSNSIILNSGTGAYKIQREVRELLSLKTQEDWAEKLKKKGEKHRYFYHYTTLSTLKAILQSSRWRMKLASKSNDFHECNIHNASFTTGILSSMGMWTLYSGLKDQGELGVRIGIPRDVFKEIFSAGNIQKKSADGSFEMIRENYEVVITDVAYWYFGKEDDGSRDRLFYKGYEFPFNALGIYDKKTLNKAKKKAKTFTRPKPDIPLPPCFKRAVWRSEAETRVYCDFRENGQESIPLGIPGEVYARIKPEHFQKMEFRLSPKAIKEDMFSSPDDREKMSNLLLFFGMECFVGNKIKLDQFIPPSVQEDWQDNNEGK